MQLEIGKHDKHDLTNRIQQTMILKGFQYNIGINEMLLNISLSPPPCVKAISFQADALHVL